MVSIGLDASKSVVLSVALLLALAPAAGGLLPLPVSAADGDASAASPTEIDSCTVIDQPGSYVLTSDIENSSEAVCIDIRDDDVTFDGAGHTIEGNLSRADINDSLAGPPPRTRVGVGVNVRTSERVENVTVEDVTTTNWFHGVLAENVTGGHVADVTAHDNGGGIIYDNLSNVAVRDSNSSNNLILGTIVDSRAGVPNANNTVENNTLLNNGAFGAAVFLSNNSTVANNVASNNGFVGVFAIGTSNSTFANNTAANNAVAGLVVEGVRPNASNLSELIEDVEPAVPAPSNSRDNLVVGNDLTDNGVAGLALVTTDGTRAVGNDVSGTGPAPFPFVPFGSAGVFVDDATDVTVADTTARDVADLAYAGLNNSSVAVVNMTTDTGVVSFEGTNVGVGPATDVPEPPAGQEAFGVGLNTTALGPEASLSVTFHYDEAALSEANLNEQSLNVYRCDRESEEWTVVCEGYVLDTDANTVTATVDEFGVVAPLANDDPNSTST